MLPPPLPKCKPRGFLLNSQSSLAMMLPLDLWPHLLLSFLVTLLRPYQFSCCFSDIPYFILYIALVFSPLPCMFLSYMPCFLTSFSTQKCCPLKSFSDLSKNSPYSVPPQQVSEFIRVCLLSPYSAIFFFDHYYFCLSLSHIHHHHYYLYHFSALP